MRDNIKNILELIAKGNEYRQSLKQLPLEPLEAEAFSELARAERKLHEDLVAELAKGTYELDFGLADNEGKIVEMPADFLCELLRTSRIQGFWETV